MNSLTILVVVGCLGLSYVSDSAADDPAGEIERSLDDALLDDLDSDLLDGLDDLPAAEPNVDKNLLDQLGDGEDVEIGQQTDPLTHIANRMRTAEQLIANRDTSEKTQQLQKEILEDLAALIDVQKKRAAQAANRPARPKPGNPDFQAGTSAGPERSTPRLGKPEAVEQDLLSQQDLYKKTWGNLPKRFVDQMLNSNVESFLPEYAKLIEEYFIRLAEQDVSK